ncbi:TPA: hypothetical protein ACH3X1_002438 [Trebouxia sp. C0004]
MLLSGEARPRWVDTELYVKCTDVFGGDPSVNPTAILDDDIPAGKEGAECAMNEDSGTIMDDARHLWNNKIVEKACLTDYLCADVPPESAYSDNLSVGEANARNSALYVCP